MIGHRIALLTLFGAIFIVFVNKSLDFLLDPSHVLCDTYFDSSFLKFLSQPFVIYGLLLQDLLLPLPLLKLFISLELLNHFKLVHGSEILSVFCDWHQSHGVSPVGLRFQGFCVGKRLVRGVG